MREGGGGSGKRGSNTLPVAVRTILKPAMGSENDLSLGGGGAKYMGSLLHVLKFITEWIHCKRRKRRCDAGEPEHA